MDAVTALVNRVSISRVSEPAPNEQQRQAIFSAALRAADHGQIRPWRFLIVEGESREALGELYARAALAEDPALPDVKINKLKGMPLRAPLVVVVIARPQAHTKVPEIEQVLSAGAAAQNMVNAAFAVNIGAIWRTGETAYSKGVKEGLGLSENEQIVGYLYLGTPVAEASLPQALKVDDFFKIWP